MKKSKRSPIGDLLRDTILGGQDGLVNVLGIILGVATATQDSLFILVAGISALFAEALSMGAVAFTSSKAARDYYRRVLKQTRGEIKSHPQADTAFLRSVFSKKGFSGATLDGMVATITGNKELWAKTVVNERLGLTQSQYAHPLKIGGVVLFATAIGSTIPLLPFFFLGVLPAMLTSIIISAIALFIAGILKAKYTVGSWTRSGLEMLAIGMVAAIAGFVIGEVLKRVFF